MDQAVESHQELAERLAAALRQDEFVIYSQQIAPLAPNDDARPFQEILIRFQEEETKLLPPGTFFPILEDCGLLPYVDRWVVSRIARWVHTALKIRHDWAVPHNSINLSAATLTDRGFAEYTRKHLHAAALPAGTLSFEITCEHALDQVKAVQKLMELLRREGCRFILARLDGGGGVRIAAAVEAGIRQAQSWTGAHARPGPHRIGSPARDSWRLPHAGHKDHRRAC